MPRRRPVLPALAAMAALALGWEAAGQEVGCGCRVFPFEGSYGGPTTLNLSYENGDVEQCPTALRLTGKRRDGNDADVRLECPEGGDRWAGLEDSPFGFFAWEIGAPTESLASELATPASQLPMEPGVRMAKSIKVHLGLPAMLHSMGKLDRDFELSLTTAAAAAPCVCEKVRRELDFLRETLANYNRSDLLAEAKAKALRGKKSTGDFWMDNDRRLRRFEKPQQGAFAYDDLVRKAYTDQFEDEETVPAEQAKAEQAGGGDQLEVAAYAQTHPIRCEVMLPPPETVRKMCDPAIIILAAIRHEEQHAERCRSLNDPPTYSIDGKTLNWKMDADTFTGMLYHDGQEMPRSGYDAWSQNPVNKSEDERASYGIEVKMLQDYLDAHCKG